MRAVLVAFAAIWAVTAVGWVVDRSGVLGAGAGTVLARLVFFVLNPALLLHTLATTAVADMLTGALAAFVASALLVAALAVAVARWVGHRTPAEAAVAGLAASYVNAGNLGIPVAAYVLGDVAFVVPVLLFQVLVAAPVALAVLDASTQRRQLSARRLVTLPARNPMILASAVGVLLAVSGWSAPPEVLRPFDLLGSAAAPAALLALGMSLHGARPGTGDRAADVYLVVALKVLVQPAAAYLVGRFALGLPGPALLAAAVTAGLPTAQNVFVYAARYDRAPEFARDAVALSTGAAVVTLAAVSAVLS